MPSILLTPPAAEPISLAEAKAFLRVAHDDDDDVIAALIAAARIHVEAQTRRALIAQTWRLTRDDWPGDGRVALLPAPLREVLAVRTYDEGGAPHELNVDDFTADAASAPAILVGAGVLPMPGRAVAGIEIDFEAGYGTDGDDVPQALRQALRLLLGHWYENRAMVGKSELLPGNVAALIAPFRVVML
jgi:uncharacterized phiE125 gp8 family phage protein